MKATIDFSVMFKGEKLAFKKGQKVSIPSPQLMLHLKNIGRVADNLPEEYDTKVMPKPKVKRRKPKAK